MSQHTAVVSRDGKFWFVDIRGVGATQAHRLSEVPEMAKDYIHLVTDEATETIDVVVDLKLPDDASMAIAAWRSLREEARVLQQHAAAEASRAARELKGSGWTMREIGTAMDISPQRAQQLLTA